MRGRPRKVQACDGAAEAAARPIAIAAALEGVRRLNRALRVSARRAEEESGLSPAQLFVLGQIGASPRCSLSELADHTHTDRTSVAAMVERLAARGLVLRGRGAVDRRRVEIRLSAAGARLLARAPASPTRHLLAGLEELDDAALARVVAGLDDLLRAIGAAGEPAPMLFEEDAPPARRPRRPPAR